MFFANEKKKRILDQGTFTKIRNNSMIHFHLDTTDQRYLSNSFTQAWQRLVEFAGK